MRRILSLFTVLMLSAVLAFAQNRVITGKVVDEKNEPIPGASVRIKGSKSGVAADADGSFRINAKTGDVIVITGSGLEAKEVTIGSENSVTVTIKRTNQTMTEVVVTALGVARSAKELGYSATKVKGAEITQARAVNLQNGLTGKVSGLNVATINNGVFADTRIILRGIRSLTGNNQPMLIVDGVPVDLNFINRINPNDIADVNVIKGAAGTAIYGPDGVNGAIIVTTKKGSRGGKPIVNVSHTTQFEQVAFMPKFQTRFGSGSSEDAAGFGQYTAFENQCYGPEFDGSEVVLGRPLADGSEYKISYVARPEEKLKFWNTGVTTQNDVSLTAGNFFLSAQDANIKGVVPKDQNRRTAFRFNAAQEYGKFKASFNLTYALQNFNYHEALSVDANNPRADGLFLDRDHSVMWLVINTPMQIPLTRFKDWQNDPWSNPNGYFNDYYDNPYYVLDAYRTKGKRDDFLGNIELSYKPFSWMSALYRLGTTVTSSSYKNTVQPFVYSPYAKSTGKSIAQTDKTGQVIDDQRSSNRINSELILTFNRSFGKFKADLLLGNNVRQNDFKATTAVGRNLVIPTLFNLSNRTGEAVTAERNSRTRLVRYFGKLAVGYNDWAFFEVTGNYDQDSRLPADKREYFYPGASASVLLTEAIPALKGNKTLSYAKLRGSWTKTGNVNLGAYELESTFSAGANFPYGNLAGFTANNTVNNPAINPEFVISQEVGLELGLFKNRVNIEISAYQQKNTDQILNIRTSYATGYESAQVNAANFTNKGIDFDLRLTPLIKLNNGLTIDFKGNLSINDNEVTQVYEGLDEITIGNNNYVIKGYPAYTLKLSDYKRDPEGRVIVDAVTGYPSKDPNLRIYGRTLPKFILGLNPSVSWKGFTLAATADYRSGHQRYNGEGPSLDFTGVSYRSGQNARRPFVYPNSVYFDGTKYVPNTSIVTFSGGYGFWETAATNTDIQSNYVTSAAAWKVREISLSYDIPASVLGNGKIIKKASVSLVGRNLFMWVPKTNEWGDPEFTSNSGSANAFGNSNIFLTPATRIFGFNVNLTF